MATLIDIDGAIYTKLKATSAVTALVGGTAVPRIYMQQAPSSATLPYVIFYLNSGGVANLTPREDFNVTYRIEAVADTRQGAQSLSEACFGALHRESVTVTGWSNFYARVDNMVSMVDNQDARQYYRKIFDVDLMFVKD